jgi:DNA-binding response OmpR family regulator
MDSVRQPGTVAGVLADGIDQLAEGARQHSRGPFRVLVIDRDRGFVQVLSKRMDAVGWAHTVVSTPVTPEALVRMRLNAVIVDVTVIGPDCWSYLERICSRLPSLAVVVSTGPSSVAQRVRGLRLGVDSWVTKPCHPEEMICVVEAALRRNRRRELTVVDPPRLEGDLTIRSDLHQVYVGELSAELTAREFEILQLLAQSDRVLRREEIYERIWGYAMGHGDRSVDVFVGKLRQKLRSISPHWTYIHTHFGVGYRFAPSSGGGGEDASTPRRDIEVEVATLPAADADFHRIFTSR